MKLISSPEEVLNAVQHAKKCAVVYCTNFYPSQPKLADWIANGQLRFQVRENSVLFLREDRDFWHLYFCASNRDSLSRCLCETRELRQEAMVADVIGEFGPLEGLIPVLAQAGLRPYNQLSRMVRPAHKEQPTPADDQRKSGRGFANEGEGKAILTLIEAAFDRYSKQIPSTREIHAAIEACQILTVRHEDELAGLLFFETRGVTSTLRFWTVAEQFRDRHLGSELMRQYLTTQSTVQRFVLWVESDNTDTVQKYRHYHYTKDRVTDYVLANDLIPR